MKTRLVTRLIRFTGLFAALLGGFSASAAGPLGSEVELGVYRFFGRPDTNSAMVGIYKLEDGLFNPKQVGTLTVQQKGREEECTRLLSQLQSFPLNVMTQVNYLSPGELNSQEQLIKLFAPEQVTFLELTEPVLKAKVEADPKTYPHFKLSQRPDEARPDHIHVRQAGMWIVSGQSMYPWGGEVFERHHPQSTREKMEITWETAIAKERGLTDHRDPHLVLLTLTAMP